jgi:uncharacterized protein involved in exopolysaccharide biosynthesis
MSTPARSVANPSQSKSTLRRYSVLWMAPTIALAALACVYAFVRPVKWRAAQAIVVRDEAGGATTVRQGRFDTTEAMKTAQETLVQLSRNPNVVKAALVEAGPFGDRPPHIQWPSDHDVQDLQSAISVGPPKGGEFGRNEVIYVSVEGPTRERAVSLASAVCNQLEVQLQTLRKAKAESLIGELEKAVGLAEADLATTTAKLEAIEQSVGRDLDELRSLTEANGGTSNLRSASNQLKDEIRRTQVEHDANTEQLKLLTEAQADSNRLLAAPQRLFEQQPALRRLKEGLVDAQLRTAQLAGRMSADHPEVQAAKLAEDEVRQKLDEEIGLVVRNLQNDLKVSSALLTSLQEQSNQIDGRLQQVAAVRADYANQLTDVRQRSESLAKLTKDLADARASHSAALSTSLIARLDKPDPGNAPVGPTPLMIVAAGAGGGLTIGLGLVFLTAPLASRRGRRATDNIGQGRRATDQAAVAPTLASQQPQQQARREPDMPQQYGRRISDIGASRRAGNQPAQQPAAAAASQPAGKSATPPPAGKTPVAQAGGISTPAAAKPAAPAAVKPATAPKPGAAAAAAKPAATTKKDTPPVAAAAKPVAPTTVSKGAAPPAAAQSNASANPLVTAKPASLVASAQARAVTPPAAPKASPPSTPPQIM